MQIKDPRLLAEFRAKKFCEWCGHKGQYLQPHHLFAKGMGGGSRLDVRVNLIALCNHCHDKAHLGAIPRSELQGKVAAREGVTADGLVDEIHRLQREPKRAEQ